MVNWLLCPLTELAHRAGLPLQSNRHSCTNEYSKVKMFHSLVFATPSNLFTSRSMHQPKLTQEKVKTRLLYSVRDDLSCTGNNYKLLEQLLFIHPSASWPRRNSLEWTRRSLVNGMVALQSSKSEGTDETRAKHVSAIYIYIYL